MQWKPLEDEFDIIAVLCWVTLPCARILRKKYDTCFHRYGILWRQISRRFRHVSPSLHLWAVSCTNSHPELDPISGLPRSTHRSRRTSLSSWTKLSEISSSAVPASVPSAFAPVFTSWLPDCEGGWGAFVDTASGQVLSIRDLATG